MAENLGRIKRRTLFLLVVGGAVAAWPVSFSAIRIRGNAVLLDPDARVGGVSVGGMSPAEALAHLETVWAPFLANPAIFKIKGQVWRPTASDIGLRADFRAPLRELVIPTSGGGWFDLFSRAREVVATSTNAFTYDRDLARRYILSIAAEFDRPAVDAGLRIRSDERLDLIRSQNGRVADVEQALDDLEVGVSRRLGGHVVEVKYREDVPKVSTVAAEAAIRIIRRLVSQPIWLMHGNRGWVLEPAQLIAAIVTETRGGQIEPRFEFTRFNELFRTIEQTLTAEARHGVFEFDERTDRVIAFEPGNRGQRFDRTVLEKAIQDGAHTTNARRIEIPVIVHNKDFDHMANPLGVKDLLAVGSSIYKGSPDYRDHNIAVGASKLNGMIVRPGETFSFNERIGRFTVRNGWTEGSVIVEDKTEQGIGGGICQVSTTLFRAALAAGLPIEERWPHLYRVRYYEMGALPIGYDATIFSPGIDLKFFNDYETPIMLRTRLDRRLATLDFEIWGASDGRVVTLGEPRLWDWVDPPDDEGIVDATEAPDFEEQVEFAKRGVQAEVTRTIVRADGKLETGVFRSSYKAWPNRFVVGIDHAKARFPSAYNKWFDENLEEAARWGVEKVSGVPSDPDAPSG